MRNLFLLKGMTANELNPAGTNTEVSMELASDYGGIAGTSIQSSFPVLRFIEFLKLNEFI